LAFFIAGFSPNFVFDLRKPMRLTVRYLSFIFLLLLSGAVSAQRIGVVLSGGGAKAAAHIGFLKALEENEIPIDYITGSSMGAVVGGMYASGLSIHQIDSIVRSEEYIRMAEGDIDDELRFFFKEEAPSASMGTIKFTRGKLSTLLSHQFDQYGIARFQFYVGIQPSICCLELQF